MSVLVHFLFSLAGRLGFPVIFNQSLTQMVSPEETREAFSFKKSPVFWWFYQTVNVLKMPRSRSVLSFRNSQGKLGVHNPLTPGKYAVYFTFSSTRKTWLNSALSLVNRKFYQTVNVRKISRSWPRFPTSEKSRTTWHSPSVNRAKTCRSCYIFQHMENGVEQFVLCR